MLAAIVPPPAIPVTTPDDDLLARWRDHGDAAAANALLERHVPLAHRVALRICGHASDADDALQEGLLAALRAAGQYRPRAAGSVRAWLLAIVTHAARRHQRAARRRAHHEALAPLPAAAPLGGVPELPTDELVAALASVREQERVPLLLRHADGLPIEAICTALGRPPQTVRSQIDRGLLHLREAFARRGRRADADGVLALLATLPAPAPSPAVQASLPGLAATAAPLPVLAPPLAGTLLPWVVGGVIAAGALALVFAPTARPQAPTLPRSVAAVAAVVPAPPAPAAVPPVAPPADDAGAALGRILAADGAPLDGGTPLPATWRAHAPRPGVRWRPQDPPWWTGVKAIDWCATLPWGGVVSYTAGLGVGRTVLVGELAERLHRRDGRTVLLLTEDGTHAQVEGFRHDLVGMHILAGVTVVVCPDGVPAHWQTAEATTAALAEAWRDAGKDVLVEVLSPPPTGCPELTRMAGTVGDAALTVVVAAPIDAPIPTGPLPTGIDARIVLRRTPENSNSYPLVDPLACATRALGTPAQQQVYDAVRTELTLLRARAQATDEHTAVQDPARRRGAQLQAYFSQPFFTTVGFVGRPGTSVDAATLWENLGRITSPTGIPDAPRSLMYEGALPPPPTATRSPARGSF